jgi:Ni,Fe-hydrogenase III large subunit/Ni,Fe-hydrogenase III component G
MGYREIIKDIESQQGTKALAITEHNQDEVYISVRPENFNLMCTAMHKKFKSPVKMLFAEDSRQQDNVYSIYAVFLSSEYRKWLLVRTDISKDAARFTSLAKDMYSASLFEREIYEMFGIEPVGNPDLRRRALHEEVWPQGVFPLRKDFKKNEVDSREKGEYQFSRIEGEGVFEVPVGPVHAGIIGPGHFRFSAAGEPIINLEIRLGFTHKGVEKLFEGVQAVDAVRISECISGDTACAYSMAFCQAVERIYAVSVPRYALLLRGVFLELERMYNHVADIGGMATDVGFSFPAMYAALIKENILSLNETLTGSRYLKGINKVGGVSGELKKNGKSLIADALDTIEKDCNELRAMLLSTVSFMDRVDTAGILRKKTAEDLGISGVAARASGIAHDLRKIFPGIYDSVKFKPAKQEEGDCLARLHVRCAEFFESIQLIKQFLAQLEGATGFYTQPVAAQGFGMGYVEAWRGPVLYWIKLDKAGIIQRCKIVDPSFLNWQGLSFAVLGNIIPDFPLCNKSFNLSYSGNDL